MSPWFPRSVTLFGKVFALVPALVCLLACPVAQAGGPRWTAGTTYFNSSVKGQQVVWAQGSVVYFTDQGALSAYESNAAASAMVAAAALPWTQVATAQVSITRGGSLAEDVTGADVSGSLRDGTMVWPNDVESLAVPVAIIYDADGSVLNAILGAGASDASGCFTNAVSSISDGFSVQGNLTHAIVILNGLCATDATQVTNMQFLLMREFGRVLGLDWSQANDNVFTDTPWPTESDFEGWPLMHPVNLNCDGTSYNCLPNPMELRLDDRAALGRLYPAAAFASTTIRLHGTISFAGGQGMQGVLVTATRVANGTTNADTTMVASCVSGFAFRGNVGNAVTGTIDAWGNPMARFGSDVATLEGEYDLGGLEVPEGLKKADYQLTFSAINPLYTAEHAVGPQILGAPVPSGTLATIIVRGSLPGASVEKDLVVSTSAAGGPGLGGSFASATAMPAKGTWSSRLSGYGDADWLSVQARPNRWFSVITQATNEAGEASESKAMPVIGAWFGDDAAGVLPDFATPQAFDSSTEGATVLQVQTGAGNGPMTSPIVLAVADARGDGRPDYSYAGRVLYADSIMPESVPASGGVVTISGMGFVDGESVTVNGVKAPVLAWQSQQLVVEVPDSSVPGPVDVQVNDSTGGAALMSGALTYGTPAANTLQTVSVFGGGQTVSGLMGAQAAGMFTVEVQDANGNPVSGVGVTFSATNAGQLSICGGNASCTIASSGSGFAATTLIAPQAGLVTVTASLADGATAQSQWQAVSSVEGVQFAQAPLEVAPNHACHWPVSVTAIADGAPRSAVAMTFKVIQGGQPLASAIATTNAMGVASYTALVPVLTAGAAAQVQACLPDMTCATVEATAVNPAYPEAIAISGASQSVNAAALLAPLQLELTDGMGEGSAVPSNPIEGELVVFSQTLYTYEATHSGKAPPVRILATSTQSAISDTNGMVAIQPLQQDGVPGTVAVTVSIGTRVLGSYSLSIMPADAASAGGSVPIPRRKRLLTSAGLHR